MSAVTVYPDIVWPAEPTDRPWVAMNMISTLDGKIVAGDIHAPAKLGSGTDQATLKSLEDAASGIIIGRATLEDTPGLWYPAHVKRYVVSGDSAVPTTSRFFTDAPDQAYVVTTEKNAGHQTWPNVITSGESQIDFAALMTKLRHEHKLRCLLVEGGSNLNASFFSADLVDELFLTVAPVIKMGKEVPTIAGGKPLAAPDLRHFALVSHVAVGDELFLRYRRRRD